jgi:hypothetical protein
MKKSFLVIAAAVACAAWLRPAQADDMSQGHEPSAEEKAMMEAWQRYATPGEAHKVLAALEGDWALKVTSWMTPGQPPQESTGTAKMRMILGGRYLKQSAEGTMMGQPFSGLGLSGYDNAKKVYQDVWIDNAGTGMMMTTGSWDEASHTMTSTGSMVDPVSGKSLEVTGKIRHVDPDHFRYEMWMPGPDGKPFKTMEIEYSRKM